MDGALSSCKGSACEVSCCTNGYREDVDVFLASPRGKAQAILEENGILLSKDNGNRFSVSGCSDGSGCKMLRLFPDEDIRSLACKIYPYKSYIVSSGESETIDTIGIVLENCPAVSLDFGIPDTFTDEVIKLIKDYHLEYFDREVDVKVIESFQKG